MSTNALPSQSTEFPAWYGEVVRRAGLAENSPVRGAMVIKPYGYAIWEAIQRELDDRIKATGHENFYLPPLFVPASVLAQEGELIEGFAPEVALVTEAGGKTLEEPLAVRPTSARLPASSWRRGAVAGSARRVEDDSAVTFRCLPLDEQPARAA
jgi:prolyl-tRNA synthetase